MPNTINADNGVVSGFAGVRTTADGTGNLALQSNGNTVLTLNTANAATFAGAVTISGATTQTGAANFSSAVTITGASSTTARINMFNNAATSNGFLLGQGFTSGTDNVAYVYNTANAALAFGTNNLERMRLDSSGNLLIGTTNANGQISVLGTNTTAIDIRTNSGADVMYVVANTGGSAATGVYVMPIRTGSTSTFQGGIQWTGSVIAYNVSSDYRLKEDVAPMVGALDSVLKLKPVTYTWKSNGAFDNGFIAHELQEVLPSAVSGKKDALFEDGSMNPQCVDYSKLVATLTSAIQELNAKVDAQAAEIAALKAGA